MLGKTVGFVVNRLVVGFVFAFIYQALTGIATSLLSIPLTGTIQDLIWGIESADQEHSTLAIAWWIISTVIFTTIATQIVRFRRFISPYKKEKLIYTPPNITVLSLVILGATMSCLFFLLDLAIGTTASVADVATIYETAIRGDYRPLGISVLFSMVAGFIVVGVIMRAGGKVKQLTRGVGAIDMESIKKKFAKKEKTTADTRGLAPGALVHVGKRKVERVWFSALQYDGDGINEVKKTHDLKVCLDSERRKVNWFNMTGVHDAQSVQEFGRRFDLHELHQADIMNTELRPSIDTTKNKIFMVLKMPHYDDDGDLIIEHISLMLGDDYAISFQEAEGDVFDRVRENIRKSRGEFRNMGSDYLAYALIDAIVDNFFVILERIGNRTEDLERVLMTNPDTGTLQEIYALKRQMITLRKAIWPMREVINSLERSDSPIIRDSTRQYLRDVYNHTVQTMDTIESLRDVVGGMLDTYLSSMSNKMNEVMKTLTIIASIFIPITFIAGIYGTNFAYVPELELEGGYFIMLGTMGAITGIMLLWFRRKSWL